MKDIEARITRLLDRLERPGVTYVEAQALREQIKFLQGLQQP